MKRPQVLLTAVFCSGIIVAGKAKSGFFSIYLLSVLFLIFSFLALKKKFTFSVLLICLVFLQGILFLRNSQILAKCHISNLVYYKDRNPYIIKGFVDSPPEIKGNRTIFLFNTEELQHNNFKHNCCGKILVFLRGKNDLHYGEELILKGELHRPFSFRDKRKNYRGYLYNQGIYLIMRAGSQNALTRLNRNRGIALIRFALWLKAKIEAAISKHTSLLTASVIDAMILGERRSIPALINNNMVKTGTVHILVVSGFNVGIVAFIIMLFLKLIRLPRKARFLIAILGLVLYCLMTGASNPVVRSTVMGISFFFAYLIKREPDIYNSCALSAMFILVFNPGQLFDIGFQLSFVSVISIISLYPKLKTLLGVEAVKIKFLRVTVDAFLVSLSAWAGTMGFIAYYFKIFSPITVIANIFVVPLATLITLCGFSLAFIGIVFAPIAAYFGLTCELLVSFLIKLNALLIRLPGAYFYLP